MKNWTKWNDGWRGIPTGIPAVVGLALTLLCCWGGSARAEDKAEYVGAETCLACHTEKEGFKDSVHGRRMPALKGVEFSKTCETCHGPGSLHAAAAGDRGNPGYATIHNPKKMTAAELSETCLQCHQDSRRLHWKGGPHESRDVSCVACHSVHAAKSDGKLLKEAAVQDVCFACHKDIKAQTRRSAHMPVAEGKITCTDCHNPHGSATPKQLNAESVNALCYNCHAEKRGPFLWEHLPVRENCLNCHLPHGSHHDKMLVAKRPFLCQRCHAGTRHPSGIYDQTDITNRNNRVFSQACQECHSNIHGSNHPSGKFFLR